MLVVIDYHMGNLGSVMNMFRHIGVEAVLSSDPKTIGQASKLVLPGVGAFDMGMNNLHELGIVPALHDKVLGKGTPILGVCLGMQLFGNHSEEGSAQGLGWIDAVSRRFPASPNHRVPHMGWNTLQLCKHDPLLDDMELRSRFYFVHSYYVEAHDPRDVLAQTIYGASFTSAVSKKNIWGMQFHPEKSLKWGMHVLGKFAEYA